MSATQALSLTTCHSSTPNPSSIFLAAAYYTVSRYTNNPDVCFCTISNGRSNLRISDTIGMFVNTVAIVSHIKDVTVKDFIQQTAADFSTTFEHENYLLNMEQAALIATFHETRQAEVPVLLYHKLFEQSV